MEINFLAAFKPQTVAQKTFAQNPIRFKGNLEADTFEPSAPVKRPHATKKEMAARRYEKESEKYQKQLEYHPGSAFLYDPDVKIRDRYEAALVSDTILDINDVARRFGVTEAALNTWAAAGVLEIDNMDETFKFMPVTRFIDTKFPKNEEFLNELQTKAKTSVSGYELINLDRISPSTLQTRLKNGELKPLGFDEKPRGTSIESVFFDLSDETNAKTITGLRRLTPHASKKYFKPYGNTMVPAKYLEKLGYASARGIMNLVRKGVLPGTVETVQTDTGKKYRVFVDTRPYVGCEEKLTDIRKANKNVVTIPKLAQELGLTQKNIKEAVVDGRLDIIDEYIFAGDSDVLINKSAPKNAEFIDKALFEKQVAQELLEEKRAEQKREAAKRLADPLASLRMKIVWSMCPRTKAAASETAKRDGYVSAVIAKKAEGKEELTDKEEIKYRTYCDTFWTKAGTDEFKNARAKADAIIDQYKKSGVEGIEDENARKIIEQFLKETPLS